jgi:hypothetical protein
VIDEDLRQRCIETPPELAVHRMDLEAAAGRPHDPLDETLAEGGVDELLTVVLPRWAHTEPVRSALATVEGAPVQLLLRFWGRSADVVVTGDVAAEALLRGR